MTVATRRDVESTRTRLAGWLAGKLRAADVAVGDLMVPRAGYSNETVFCEVSWTDWRGRRVQRSLVLRIEPTGHQLFARPDAVFQARMMTTLARETTVPVPEVLFVETDPEVFGAPFYVMERVAGRIPPDVPSWHRKGWVTGLGPAERARMHDNALTALAQLHAVDAHRYFAFLEPADGQPPFDAYLDGLRAWHSWAEPDVRYDADVVKAAVAYVDEARPHRPEEVVVWRDARPGNIIFADDLSVAALLDWETSTLGPPGVDLGWWVVFDEYLCEAQGLTRLDGVPGREATIERYQELTGREVPDVGYYEVLAALELSLITSKLTRLLIEDGLAEPIAVEYTTRVTGMLAGKLARVGA